MFVSVRTHMQESALYICVLVDVVALADWMSFQRAARQRRLVAVSRSADVQSAEGECGGLVAAGVDVLITPSAV